MPTPRPQPLAFDRSLVAGFIAKPYFEIDTAPHAVWVNASDGCCVARFGRHGAEVHRDARAQMRGEGECLSCDHGRSTLESWDRWVASVRDLLGVEVPETAKPRFLTAQS